MDMGDARAFIAETYKHGKAIGGVGEAGKLIARSLPDGEQFMADSHAAEKFGVVVADAGSMDTFVTAIGERYFGRPSLDSISV